MGGQRTAIGKFSFSEAPSSRPCFRLIKLGLRRVVTGGGYWVVVVTGGGYWVVVWYCVVMCGGGYLVMVVCGGDWWWVLADGEWWWVLGGGDWL